MIVDILKEARRLYEMGGAPHWIQKNSKAPVKAGWSGPKRDTWDQLARDYQEGYGLGIRLGQASHIGDGYLANIDIDVKSADERHRLEALQFVRTQFPEAEKAPVVYTGYGMRLFVATKTPMESRKLFSSPDSTVVKMPTAQINQRQRAAVKEGKITEAQLAMGYRVRPAWEVEFMSAGKQVVLPPSIHPDTKRPYIWGAGRELKAAADLPLIELAPDQLGKRAVERGLVVVSQFKPAVIDYLDSRFTDRLVSMIMDGDGVEDRSAACFSVALTMSRAGFTDEEILTVLTDRDTFLGEVAYEHRATKNRDAAVAWVRDYCLAKARKETDAAAQFDCAVEVVTLSDEAAVAQAKEVVELTHWEYNLRRTAAKSGEQGAVKPILENVLMILENCFPGPLFKRDMFSGFNVYGLGTSWGGPIGAEFDDDGLLRLTEWFSVARGMEVKTQTLLNAVGIIALRHPFHPVRDYLTSLRWDGVPRLDGWLVKYLGARDADPLYLAEVSRKFIVAMVKRALEPGCQFDYMLVLHGKQGIKKSSALRILAGDKYFSSTVLQPDSKDTILKMRSKWLIEFGEMSNAKADVRALKNFITTRTDRDRVPYGKMAEDFPRRCVFAGSTNEEEIIFDTTGGRRFWVVSVSAIDLEALARDRDQLFAEAMALYDTGEPLYLSADAETAAHEEQAQWTVEDVMVEKVRWILDQNAAKPTDEGSRFHDDGFSLDTLLHELETKGVHSHDHATQRRVTTALRICGYKSRKIRVGKGTQRLWFNARQENH